jgi:hypothetical protein
MAKKKAAKRTKPNVYEFTITLAETSPVVWRKVLAHDVIELYELHMLIQMSMGWQNAHLFSFEINGKSYSDEETASEMKNTFDAEGVELKDILGDTKKFTYTYDFGDDWLHQIEITNVLEDDKRVNYPICIGGENACPPEDCGGPHGFERLKDVLKGKEGREKDEMMTWVGGFYNPNTFDPNFVNKNFLWANEEDY